ncbi:hypothetical protein ACOME3_010430 [Neoechinorhynchus agilis]
MDRDVVAMSSSQETVCDTVLSLLSRCPQAFSLWSELESCTAINDRTIAYWTGASGVVGVAIGASPEFPFRDMLLGRTAWPNANNLLIVYSRLLDTEYDLEELNLPAAELWDTYSRICHHYGWTNLDGFRIENLAFHRGVNDYVQRLPDSDLTPLGLGPLLEQYKPMEQGPAPHVDETVREAMMRHIMLSSCYGEATQSTGWLHLAMGMEGRVANSMLLRDFNHK